MQDTPSKSRLSNGSHRGTTSGQPGQQSWLERNLVPVSKKQRWWKEAQAIVDMAMDQNLLYIYVPYVIFTGEGSQIPAILGMNRRAGF
jgi:hypothetical protein